MGAFPKGHDLGSWTASLEASHLPVWLWPLLSRLGPCPTVSHRGCSGMDGRLAEAPSGVSGMEVTALRLSPALLPRNGSLRFPKTWQFLAFPFLALRTTGGVSQLAEPCRRQAMPAEHGGDGLATGPQIPRLFCSSVTREKMKTQTNFVFY